MGYHNHSSRRDDRSSSRGRGGNNRRDDSRDNRRNFDRDRNGRGRGGRDDRRGGGRGGGRGGRGGRGGFLGKRNHSQIKIPPNQEYNLSTNLFKLKIDFSKIFVYACTLGPDVKDQSNELIELGIKANYKEIREHFGLNFITNSLIFTPCDKTSLKLSFKYKYKNNDKDEEKDIALIIKKRGSLDQENEKFQMQVTGRLFKLFSRPIGYEKIGFSGYFDTNKKKVVRNFSIIPGFKSSLQNQENGFFIRLSLCHKIVRTDTAKDYLKSIAKSTNGGDWKKKAEELMEGKTVMTKYNKKFYQITSVEFNMNPLDTFKQKNGGEMSFAKYVLERYNYKIIDTKQPMLSVQEKGSGRVIYLIPECCQMSGLEDENVKDDRLMKDLRNELSMSLQEKKVKRENMINKLIDQDKDQKNKRGMIERWSFVIENQSTKCKGFKMGSGKLLLHQKELDIDQEGRGLDRNVQGEMYTQKTIPQGKNLAIIYPANLENDVKKFIRSFENSLSNCNIEVPEYRRMQIKRDRDLGEWISALKSLTPKTTLVLIILNTKGRKKGIFYDEIKNFMFKERPIPNQVILRDTITNPKNQMSIISKMIIQIQAKMGGVPWVMKDTGFTEKPTIIIALSFAVISSKNVSHICSVSTHDKNFSKFWTKNYYYPSLDESRKPNTRQRDRTLRNVIVDAFNEFEKVNGIKPQRIIIIRGNFGKGEKKLNSSTPTDVVTIEKTLYVLSNKNAKFSETTSSSNAKTKTSNNTEEDKNSDKNKNSNCQELESSSGDKSKKNTEESKSKSDDKNQEKVKVEESQNKEKDDQSRAETQTHSKESTVEGEIKIEYFYCLLNKKPNTEFYLDDNTNCENPHQGTFISDSSVNGQDEFYLNTCISRLGVTRPVHYKILAHNFVEKDWKRKIGKLFFRLSFLYYNTVGPIKVPAHFHYAERAVSTLGNIRGRNEDKVQPHQHWENMKSLYYI